MTALRLLLFALALATVAALAGCGDDDYSSDAAPATSQDLSGSVVDAGRSD